MWYFLRVERFDYRYKNLGDTGREEAVLGASRIWEETLVLSLRARSLAKRVIHDSPLSESIVDELGEEDKYKCNLFSLIAEQMPADTEGNMKAPTGP